MTARRVRRSDCSGPGIRRIKRGNGFTYMDDTSGERITDADTRARIRDLAIPPAWRDVWICRDEMGHLQAVGSDDAGRRQYLYHERWREHQDRQKFDRMERFAQRLPALRRRCNRLMDGESKLTKDRVLACATRMLDLGAFRIGSEQYLMTSGTVGMATMRREHVQIEDDQTVAFEFLAKGSKLHAARIKDARVVAVLKQLMRAKHEGDELLGWRDGRTWTDLRSNHINEFLAHVSKEEITAKDFRTWNATVLAAVSLAAEGEVGASKTARARAITRATKLAAEYLGNTPAVCRASYIDPRVFDRYQSGWLLDLSSLPKREPFNHRSRQRVERAVLDLIAAPHAAEDVVKVRPS